MTGYDSFSYAQQAITIGVADYLLKPVNFREMHEVIGKTCKKIRKNQFERQDYYELQKNYQKALPEIRAKLISDLLNGRLKDRDALEKKNESGESENREISCYLWKIKWRNTVGYRSRTVGFYHL